MIIRYALYLKFGRSETDSMFRRFLASIFGETKIASPVVADEWLEGGLYVAAQENGTYVPLKILRLDTNGVHVRVYSNVLPNVPASIDEPMLYMAGIDKRENEPLGMGHLPISSESFSSWGAIFVQRSSVSPEELEGYEMWLEADGGYF